MLVSKPCRYVLLFASFFSANAEEVVDLGTAENYTILTKAGITNVEPSVITGDIAVSPITGAAMTGFALTATLGGTAATSSQVSGLAYGANYIAPTPAVLTAAVLDMQAAYTNAAARTTTSLNLGAGLIGGLTLTPGVYTFGSNVVISDDLTFEGTQEDNTSTNYYECDAPDTEVGGDDVFIIQISGYLTLASAKKIILTKGAQAKNIFWKVTGYIAVGTTAEMKGILLCATKVDMLTGSSLEGRILAQTACNLQMATIAP